VHSPLSAATSADDTVRLDNIGATDNERHAEVLEVFTAMVERNNAGKADGVSRVFSLSRINAGEMPGWRDDAIGAVAGGAPAYEAVITAGSTAGSVGPAMLTYVNRRGHTVRVW
jgi:hypothetical protein